jgi:MazG family protein
VTAPAPPAELDGLLELIRTLRGENGCPWDRRQTPETLSVYLIEEMYELVEAVQAGAAEAVCEELGDVLFQVLFLGELYREAGAFDLPQVVARNLEKMVRRHPHVFGSAQARDAEEVRRNWQAIKQQEKGSRPEASLLDSVPRRLPALMKAYRISARAAGAGFDWDSLEEVMAKVEEEWAEFKAAVRDQAAGRASPQDVALEFGDILFTLTNVARFARIHPETALGAAVDKFERRFRILERLLAEAGLEPSTAGRAVLERGWEQAKRQTP